MAEAERMAEEDLKSIIQQNIHSSIGYLDGDLSNDRRDSLERYEGQPYGNEIEGRSSVVTREVMDTIEWILPSLLRIFFSSENIGEFQPEGEEDIGGAEQATDYVNFIAQRDNPGFMIVHTWFKDALLQKLGVIKTWWDEREDVHEEVYTNLDEGEYLKIAGDDEVEILEHTVKDAAGKEYDTDDGGVPIVELEADEPFEPTTRDQLPEEFPDINLGDDGLPEAPLGGQLGSLLGGAYLHDLRVKRRNTVKRVRTEGVPPEEFLVSRRTKTLVDAPFSAHRTPKTASELIEAGYSQELVDSLPSDDGDEYNDERVTRYANEEEYPTDEDYVGNQQMRTIWVTECYIRVDWDGDGIAELRQITVAGNGTHILENEAIEENPFSDITPIPMPHKLHGFAVADIIKDLQLIKTTILRQILDNLYLTNNGRTEVVDGQVNLDDLLTSRPGGVVRVKRAGMIREIVTNQLGQPAYDMLGYLDELMENRSGVSRKTQGLDADTLHETAAGLNMALTAAQARVELIARIFAETGVKDWFRKILRLAAKHQDKPRMIRLRNKFVEMDPRSWNARMDYTISVGLGHGNREMMVAMLTNLLDIQEKIVERQGGVDGPLVTLKNIHHTVTKRVEAMGFKDADKYFAAPKEDDENAPGQEQQPDPKLMAVQAKIKHDQQKLEADIKLDREKWEHEKDMSERKFRLQEKELEAEIQLKIAGQMAGAKASANGGAQKGRVPVEGPADHL